MNSPLTLHDFVINLLSDADARAAFDLDPDGALRQAGLTDVTAADVRDVLPLVADYVPAHLAGLDPSLPEFSTSALGADRTAAAHPLQFVAPQVVPQLLTNNSTLAAGTLGGVATGPTGLAGAVPATTGALHTWGDAGLSGSADAGLHGSGAVCGGADVSGSAGLSGDFSPAHDPAATLDAGVADATGVLSGTTDTVTGTVHDTLGGTLGSLDGLGHGPVGQLTGTLDATTHGLTNATGLTGIGSHPLDTGQLLDHTGLTGGLPTGMVGGVTDQLPALNGATDLLHGASPLGLTGTAGGAAAAHADAHPHLLDLPHLF